MNKKCTRCKEEKSLTEFFTYVSKKNGKKYPLSMCKLCHREWRREKYGHLPQSKSAISWRNRLRAEVIVLLGSKCCKCRFDDVRALQIDHVNGGGNKARKENPSWSVFYREILDGVHKYPVQLLCANCNFIKRHENKELHRKNV